MVIRTLRDYDNDNNSSSAAPVPPQWQQQQQQRGTYVDMNDDQQHQQQQSSSSSSMTSQLYQQPSPDTSESTFWSWNLPPNQPMQWYHMVLLCCCPCFVGPMCSETRKQDYRRMLRSFLFWITIVDIIYFIVEISVGGVTNTSDNASLGPPTKTLLLLGAKYAPYIKQRYHIWRLVTSIMMHAGFVHIFFNLYVQFMICLAYERRWGAMRTSVIYVLAGIGGNMLSCCALPASVSVGASGAIMGIIGARIGDVACRWSKMSRPGRISNSVNIVIMLVFIVMMSFMGSGVDWASHLGGFIVGLVLSPLVFSHEIDHKSIRYVTMVLGAGLTFIYFLATSLIFGLAVKV